MHRFNEILSQKRCIYFSQICFIMNLEKVHRSKIHPVQTHLKSQWNFSFLRNPFILGFWGKKTEP